MQVYCDKRFVGNLNYDLPDGCRQFKLAFFNTDVDLFLEEGDIATAAVASERIYTLKRRGVSVPFDDFRGLDNVALLDHAKRAYHVPDDAECEVFRDSFRGENTYEFQWSAIEVTQDEYEELFDHPDFEPV